MSAKNWKKKERKKKESLADEIMPWTIFSNECQKKEKKREKRKKTSKGKNNRWEKKMKKKKRINKYVLLLLLYCCSDKFADKKASEAKRKENTFLFAKFYLSWIQKICVKSSTKSQK